MKVWIARWLLRIDQSRSRRSNAGEQIDFGLSMFVVVGSSSDGRDHQSTEERRTLVRIVRERTNSGDESFARKGQSRQRTVQFSRRCSMQRGDGVRPPLSLSPSPDHLTRSRRLGRCTRFLRSRFLRRQSITPNQRTWHPTPSIVFNCWKRPACASFREVDSNNARAHIISVQRFCRPPIK